MDHKISFAPIYGTSPTKILELGCGSGAWAIAAAIDFPESQVIAVDISPTLQAISLPKNVHFQMADVTQHFPFESDTFDVVHARMLLMHVPHAKDVLERAAKLVKPGGWLVVDELNVASLVESGGPVVSRVAALWCDIVRAYGADGDIGGKMEEIIQNTDLFSEIHTHKVSMPICDDGSAPQKTTRLGVVFKKTLKNVVALWARRFADQGISPDLAEEFNEEIESNVRPVIYDMHFVWAMRAL
ncbi:S-adenosyl-L-methionine-dependent methyltransferase [Mycena leptocephala]|nr:S-adenosyl-L-methionine-dependent methyltransferase [Mycena leptocephala]